MPSVVVRWVFHRQRRLKRDRRLPKEDGITSHEVAEPLDEKKKVNRPAE